MRARASRRWSARSCAARGRRRGTAGLAHALQTFRVELAKFRRKEPSSLHRSDPAHGDQRCRVRCRRRSGRGAQGRAGAAGRLPPPGPHAFRASSPRRASPKATAALGGVTEELADAFDEIATAGATRRRAGRLCRAVSRRHRRPRVRRPEADVRVRIYGPLEARLQSVDRLVLGGLVEGVWPPETRGDPWLSRPMRHELGLDLPERRIGLSAHDFAQALGAPEVILTRAAKLGGAPTVASRFVQRLAAVAGEARWEAALAARRALCCAGPQARRDRQRQARAAARAEAAAAPRGPSSSASPRSSTGCATPTRSTPSTCSSCSRSTRSTRRPAHPIAAP